MQVGLVWQFDDDSWARRAGGYDGCVLRAPSTDSFVAAT
jgi:hypothetical protein